MFLLSVPICVVKVVSEDVYSEEMRTDVFENFSSASSLEGHCLDSARSAVHKVKFVRW